MKLAVLKLGSRISVSSNNTSGGTGEALSIINLLVNSGCDVDAYTKVLDKDETTDKFNIFDLEKSYLDLLNKEYDALIVINGNVNYFGGVDDPSQTLNYYIINKFKGKVFYILCDCDLLLKQIWPSIENKPWSDKYKREDIYISRDDIIYISQPRKTSKVLELARNHVNIKDCVHFPFEKFPLVNNENKFLPVNTTPKYDLLYGGTFRNSKREDDMIKYYFGYNNYNVTMFGKIEAKQFKKSKVKNLKYPNFEKSINYNLFIPKMNESLATIIIGDPMYKKLDDLAQRIYECILSNIIVFIDDSYDYNKRVFINEELRNFNYVSNRLDVQNKLKLLKEDNKFREHILNLQVDEYIGFSKHKYCLEFLDLIKERE